MLVAEGLDRHATRERLQELLADEIPSVENRRKTAMVLGRIWSWSADEHRARHTEAIQLVQQVEPDDRVWLHFGMTLLTHPFFRSATRLIGQLGRQRDAVDRDLIRVRLIGEFGELGTLRDSVSRVFFSLSDWGALVQVNGTRGDWRPLEGELQTDSADLQLWLLACALEASPKHDLLLPDLLRLPELFPFQLTIGLDTIRQSPRFEVQRQGNGWDMVTLAGKN